VYDIVVFTIGMLVFVTLAGLSFDLMGLELDRKGRPTGYLSLSFDPRERIRIAKAVFGHYRQLKRDENRIALLPGLVWVSLALSILFLMLYVLALLT
jgi:hypothetical protein